MRQSGSDNGYGFRDGPEEQALGHLQSDGEFEFRGTLLFVTYSHSRINDDKEFHRCFTKSMEHVLLMQGKEPVGFEVYGSRETHRDGVLHYHVVVRFAKRVHWRRPREALSVLVDIDGKHEIDTASIFIRKKKRWESQAKWLEKAQDYVGKYEDVFGERIMPASRLNAKEKDQHHDETIAAETRPDCEKMPTKYSEKERRLHHGHVKSFPRTRKGEPTRTHEPDFYVLPWKVPPEMKKWYNDNFVRGRSGRATVLVIVGPSHYGKTEWAMSFGRPIEMTRRWNSDELSKTDYTHLVLNDIDSKAFPYIRELASFNKPVIFTCCEDNSVLKEKTFRLYSEQSEVVIVKLHKKKLF